MTLTLTETECDFLFDLEPITVHMESDEAQHVRERNARYAEVMSAGDRKPLTAL